MLRVLAEKFTKRVERLQSGPWRFGDIDGRTYTFAEACVDMVLASRGMRQRDKDALVAYLRECTDNFADMVDAEDVKSAISQALEGKTMEGKLVIGAKYGGSAFLDRIKFRPLSNAVYD